MACHKELQKRLFQGSHAFPSGTGISRYDNGFTLLEIMLAVGLLSIVLAAVYSTFFLANRAIEGVDDSLLRLQENRSALDSMRREVQSLLFSASKKNTAFVVEDRDLYGKQTSRIVFSSFSPLIPGLSNISYYVKEKDKRLVLYKELRSSNRPQDAENPPIEVSDNIESFLIEARGADDKWVKTWDASVVGSTPRDIKISIGIRIKDRPLTLSEVASPMIRGSK